MKQLLFIFFFVIGLVINAQPPKKFYSTYGGNGYDVGYDVKQTLDGGYIITGSTSSYGQGNTDMYLLKLDSMGQKVFQSTFGGLNNEIGKSIVQLADSSFVIVGYTSSTGVGGYDVFLVKADKAGNSIWQKTIGGPDWDFANSIDTITGGGFIIGGTTYSFGNGNADGYVIKTDANGDTTWTKTFGGINDDEFKSIIQTSDGNYALTGYTKSYNDIDSGDVWVLKLNTTGDTLWRKFYGGSAEDFGNQIIEHSSGDLYIAGGTASFGVTKMNGYVLHTDNSGNYLFQRLDNTSSSYQFFNSLVFSNRTTNLVNALGKETFNGFGTQTKMLEMNLGLNYQNAIDFGSIIDDETFKIIATKDKGYACVGYTYGFGAILSDIYFYKTDSNLVGSQSIVSVSEDKINNNNFIAFPNPTNNEITISMKSKIDINIIKLYNISGQEISINNRIRNNEFNKININLQELDNGVYFLKYLNFSQKISLIR